MRREDVTSLAVAVAAPLIGGQIASLISFDQIKGKWYTKLLKKPRWNPPNWVFGVVWPVLYLGQGVASWFVYKNKEGNRKLPLGLYAGQLLLNLIWQPIFFKAHRPDVALVDSAACLGVAAAATVFMTKEAGKKGSKAVVASLMSPYVAWLAFATVLTGQIWKDNPDAHKLDDSTAPAASTPAVPAKPSSRKPEEVIKSAGAAVLQSEKAT